MLPSKKMICSRQKSTDKDNLSSYTAEMSRCIDKMNADGQKMQCETGSLAVFLHKGRFSLIISHQEEL